MTEIEKKFLHFREVEVENLGYSDLEDKSMEYPKLVGWYLQNLEMLYQIISQGRNCVRERSVGEIDNSFEIRVATIPNADYQNLQSLVGITHISEIIYGYGTST